MEQGLSNQKAKEILETVGKNEIIAKKRFSALSLFLSQFPTFINLLLFSAAIFSFFISDLVNTILIFVILLLNAVFGFLQEFKAEKSLEQLKSFITPLSQVIRDGRQIQIKTIELVPGDLVILSSGNIIPADGILHHSFHCEVDESILTGEATAVIKKDKDMLFKGTTIVKGKGMLKITKTGINSRFGQIAQTLLTLKEEPSPLTKNLDNLGKLLSIFAICIAFLTIPIGLFYGRSLFSLIILSISIAVAAIPEGLPAVITVALAIGTSRLAKKNAIIRKMPAIETLGSVGVIISDKTGTMTQNSIKVKKYHLFQKNGFNDLLKCCVLGNTATLIKKEDGEQSYDVVGDKTDGSLLLFAKDHIKDLDEFKNKGKIIDEYVFDSATKTIACLYQENSKNYVFVRGAPEQIIQNSKLTDKEKEEINNLYEKYAKEGLRLIGFGVKHEIHPQKNRSHLEDNLNFLGFVGIYDPPRLETKKTIEEARNAGIHVVMVTGDNELTAVAIAKEIGLIQKDEDVVIGKQLSKISDEELKKIILKTPVFARIEPEDKLRLVNIFKELGFVVGVTGDGVNDTLALKRADVGISMGQSGTDVARQASDIVLTDDNFATLIKAIEEGRTIYNNIVKAIVYLLSGNLSEISLVFFATLLGLPPPLLPTQILWINVVTDGLPALALASDTKDISLLKEKPRSPTEPILTKKRLMFILLTGFGLSVILLIMFKILIGTTSEMFARTIIFNALIFFHVLIAFFVRGSSIFKASKFLLLTFFTTLVVQILITFIPVFQKLFHLGF